MATQSRARLWFANAAEACGSGKNGAGDLRHQEWALIRLRERDADVLSPEALVRLHAGYRNRVLMGPTWRADVWTVLERTPDLAVAEVARRSGCSFATAWQVVQDFNLLRAAESQGR